MKNTKFKSEMEKVEFDAYVRVDMVEKEKLYENWPERRFAFVTEDQRYLFVSSNRICIFVNGKDHIRMIVQIVDNDLNEAYKRLMEIHNLIGTKVMYAVDSKAGFLVTAPEGIGTGSFAIEIQSKGKRLIQRAKYGSTINQAIEFLLSQLKN